MAKYEIMAVSTTAVVTSAQKRLVSCLLHQRQVGHRHAQDCEICSSKQQVRSASSQTQVRLGGLTVVVALGHRLGDCIASEDQGSNTLDDEHQPQSAAGTGQLQHSCTGLREARSSGAQGPC